MKHATLDIEGMSCGHCVNAVNRALASLPGVEVESVRIGRADVRFDESLTGPAQLADAVNGAGYQAVVRA